MTQVNKAHLILGAVLVVGFLLGVLVVSADGAGNHRCDQADDYGNYIGPTDGDWPEYTYEDPDCQESG